MVDVVSIVIAVISSVTAIIAAGLTAWMSYYSDERKRLSETEKLVAKYRDPLLLAATDLQSRLYNMTDQSLLNFFKGSPEQQDILTVYTCFSIGQFFSWTYILRLQAQFLRFDTDQRNKDLVRVQNLISRTFLSDKYNPLGMPFLLYRGEQLAIGEIMTNKEKEGEYLCMGYAEFVEKFKTEGKFRQWFRPIVHGIAELEVPWSQQQQMPDHRLRQVQHLLIELMDILDPRQMRFGRAYNKICYAAPKCRCSNCNPHEQSQGFQLWPSRRKTVSQPTVQRQAPVSRSASGRQVYAGDTAIKDRRMSPNA